MPDARETIVGRRTIAKGAAWTVPVIALAAAAPASAASGTCTVARLNGSIAHAEVSATEVSCWVGVGISAWPVCSGSATSVQLTLTFALPDAYSSWHSVDLTPREGTGAGPFQAIVDADFEIIADGWTCEFSAQRQPGVDPAPITFTLSAPGAPSLNLIAFA